MTKKILFLAANPTTETWIALDEECRAIESAIRAADKRDSLKFVSKWAVRPNDLLQHFHEHSPDMVHFSGHGTKAGEILLIGKNRRSTAVSGAALRSLFAAFSTEVRVVVLNACYSKPQAIAIANSVDCCVGMNDSIPDEAAIAFAAAFYQAVGFGKSIEEAFACGIAAIKVNRISGEDMPELVCRRGIDPSKVFLLNSRKDKSRKQSGSSTPLDGKSKLLPSLLAKFQEEHGELVRNTGGKIPEYGMDLWIEDAPQETKSVVLRYSTKVLRIENGVCVEDRHPKQHVSFSRTTLVYMETLQFGCAARVKGRQVESFNRLYTMH
jgi:hypothetical protein